MGIGMIGSDKPTIQELRKELERTRTILSSFEDLQHLPRVEMERRGSAVADEAVALWAIVEHPDLEWADLTKLLKYMVGANADTVAFKLHERLEIPTNSDGRFPVPIRDCAFWERTISEHQFAPTDKVHGKGTKAEAR